MIIWLASYPKSGNTLVRSMLSAYYYSKSGDFEFKLLENIKQFPNISLFKNLQINTEDEIEVVKNYIRAQEAINKQDGNSLRFLKTHSALNDINGYKFTNLNNSLGVIYIIRDPRNIVKSFANHSQISVEEAKNNLLRVKVLGGKDDPINKSITHMGSWSSNYKSWREFKMLRLRVIITHHIYIILIVIIYIHNLHHHHYIPLPLQDMWTCLQACRGDHSDEAGSCNY